MNYIVSRFLPFKFYGQSSQARVLVTLYSIFHLTHWSRVTHICIGKLTDFISSDDGFVAW